MTSNSESLTERTVKSIEYRTQGSMQGSFPTAHARSCAPPGLFLYTLSSANKAKLVPAGRWMIEGSRAPNPGILLSLFEPFGPTHPCQLGVELLLLCSFERLFIGIYNHAVSGSFTLCKH